VCLFSLCPLSPPFSQTLPHPQEQAEKKEASASADDVEAKGPTSFFHGKENEDYQVGVLFGGG
jgi:hypothetical protein